MAKFLSTELVSLEIKRTITSAESEVTVMAPDLKFPDTFFELIQEALEKGVKITVAYEKASLRANQRRKLCGFENLEIYRSNGLNANCYFNENRMIITSMEMQDYAEGTNREMGVLVRRVQDQDFFRKAVSEAESILADSSKVDRAKDLKNRESFLLQQVSTDIERIKDDIRDGVDFVASDLQETKAHLKKGAEFIAKDMKNTGADIKKGAEFLTKDITEIGPDVKAVKRRRKAKPKEEPSQNVEAPEPATKDHAEAEPSTGEKPQLAAPKRRVALHHGYCIRCGQSVDYFPDAPFCESCYREWYRYKISTHKEHYCHRCGIVDDTTSKAVPMCYPCQQKLLKSKSSSG
ncbi:MAG: hypothetical protein SVM79_04410 [Chloroflexota bacterium]|nr:hypothetical protein [Chloroflexota bacterium]